jgi:SPFH domain-Band 7 family
MGLRSFLEQQFIDVIQWTEPETGYLAYRFPISNMEIQSGAQLAVRESQMAVFVNEGRIAEVFGPGLYTLTTRTLPLLTDLKNWTKEFKSPFKSDVFLFSTQAANRSEMGHGDAHHDSGKGIGRDPRAGLRHLFVPRRQPTGVLDQCERDSGCVPGRRPGGATAGHQRGLDDGGDRAGRGALPRYDRESGGAHAAGSRPNTARVCRAGAGAASA